MEDKTSFLKEYGGYLFTAFAGLIATIWAMVKGAFNQTNKRMEKLENDIKNAEKVAQANIEALDKATDARMDGIDKQILTLQGEHNALEREIATTNKNILDQLKNINKRMDDLINHSGHK
jgi:septal ring factor EnvC (AmiA/AmiB activator)